MGAFYVVRAPAGPATAPRLRDAFARQGFTAVRLFRGPGWEIGCCGCPTAEAAGHEDGAGNAIAFAGTLFYRGAFGTAALPALLRDALADAVDEAALWGCFAVAVAGDHGLRVFTDHCGTFHLYADRDGGIVSTSFLALAETLPLLTIDRDAVYDYVFQGAPHGGTVFREILRVTDDRPPPIPDRPAPGGLDEHAGRCLAVLSDRFAQIAAVFADRVDTALSGGYDSRLVLALLRRSGLRPRLYVYGAEDDPDVLVARAITAGEGLALDHTDKRRVAPVPPEAMPELVERNCLAFDGYPNDGLFDTGADLATRLRRAEGRTLALNGGGGEIFRDFFHLPDRPMSARALVWSFYSQFDPAVGAPGFDADAYLAGLEDRIRRTLGVEGRRLTRIQVEAAYPFFRCRYWMGRNTSVNNRFGYALTPFADVEVIAAALAVPLSFKEAGRLEARMIARLDPRLAAYPSAYGHGFDRGPPPWARLTDWANRQRPPLLRRHAFRLKHRRVGDRPPGLGEDHVAAVLGRRFDYMARYVIPTAIPHAGQYNRVCTLEYLFRRLGAQ